MFTTYYILCKHVHRPHELMIQPLKIMPCIQYTASHIDKPRTKGDRNACQIKSVVAIFVVINKANETTFIDKYTEIRQ